MNIRKIVITGGPCAGKSTALTWIQNAFTKRGYTVLFVPETATELITGGVAPWTCGSNFDFQKGQVYLQREKEKVFEMTAKTMPKENILIVCDRGITDNSAYMTKKEYEEILQWLGLNEVEVRDGYDAVFHLVTAADGAVQFYTTDNNEARYETPEQAVALDRKLLRAWTGHPHLRVIDNSTDFNEKLKRLIMEISAFLGEPEPREIERKFLISYPDMNWLESQEDCRMVEITQTYLNSLEGEELRVRERGENGHYMYYLTAKRPAGPMERIEVEERLTRSQYMDLLMEADPTRHTIYKKRYCLMHRKQYFEIDIYPEWKNAAIMEIELTDPNEEIHFPEEIRILREVTDDPAFRNAALAKQMPEI